MNLIIALTLLVILLSISLYSIKNKKPNTLDNPIESDDRCTCDNKVVNCGDRAMYCHKNNIHIS